VARLTPSGLAVFSQLAARHEAWLDELLQGLSSSDAADLHGLLGKTEEKIDAK
jgi:DNA-binding MarR family transcriptional regulator